jgi:hypothetical protein
MNDARLFCSSCSTGESKDASKIATAYLKSSERNTLKANAIFRPRAMSSSWS